MIYWMLELSIIKEKLMNYLEKISIYQMDI